MCTQQHYPNLTFNNLILSLFYFLFYSLYFLQDVNRSAIVGARQNVDDSSLLYHSDSCEFHCKDARAMKSIVGDLTLDAVVTNVRSKRRRIQLLLLCLSSDRCLKFISNIHLIFSLIFFNSMFCVDMFVLMICIFLIICGQQVPWGVQTGKNVDLQAIYEIVLRTAWYCLKPGGRFVMLVLRGTKMLWLLWWWWWSLSLWLLPLISQPVVLPCCSVPGLQMMRILRKLSGRYKLLSIQVVRTTNNMPCVVVVEKLEHDLVHETLKHQLYDMSQYVNISPEMYVQSIFVFSSRGLYYFDTFNFRYRSNRTRCA